MWSSAPIALLAHEWLGEPDKIRFGGGSGESAIHPLVAAVIVFVIIVIFCRPRKYIIAPLLMALLFIPKGQVLVLAGLHFNAFRLLILAALAQRISRPSQPLTGGFNSIDLAVSLWAICMVTVFALDWRETQAVVKGLGDLIDKLGGYWSIRYLIQDRQDVLRAIKALALVSIVMGICMLNEQRTGENVFQLIGGLTPGEIIRDGKIRSQGAFEHSITAAVFGATLLPLAVLLYSERKSKLIGAMGVIGGATMTLTAHTSTALLALVGGIFALCLWPVRAHMRLMRWGLVAVLVGLHLVMNGPVWSILEHIDLTGSASSFHRYMLVDNFIRHFFDWWLLGSRDYGTWGWEMWDLSDQYVADGLTGGLITFVLFMRILYLCFSKTGRARKMMKGNRKEAWLFWCLSAAVFAHVLAFFGISYMDQVEFAWFTLLAIISVTVADAYRLSAPRISVGEYSEARQGIRSVPSNTTGEPIKQFS